MNFHGTIDRAVVFLIVFIITQMVQEANAIHDNTTSRTASLFVRANALDITSRELLQDAQTTQQRSLNTLAESQRKRNEVAQINTGLPVTNNVVSDATGKVQQAMQIQQNVSWNISTKNT